MLTDMTAKNAKAQTKLYRLFDGQGLYLEINPNGGKYWRLKYRFASKEKRLALGVYPEVSLGKAREKQDQARKLLANGIDPSQAKKEARLEQTANVENSFEIVAREWHSNQRLS